MFLDVQVWKDPGRRLASTFAVWTACVLPGEHGWCLDSNYAVWTAYLQSGQHILGCTYPWPSVLVLPHRRAGAPDPGPRTSAAVRQLKHQRRWVGATVHVLSRLQIYGVQAAFVLFRQHMRRPDSMCAGQTACVLARQHMCAGQTRGRLNLTKRHQKMYLGLKIPPSGLKF